MRIHKAKVHLGLKMLRYLEIKRACLQHLNMWKKNCIQKFADLRRSKKVISKHFTVVFLLQGWHSPLWGKRFNGSGTVRKKARLHTQPSRNSSPKWPKKSTLGWCMVLVCHSFPTNFGWAGIFFDEWNLGPWVQGLSKSSLTPKRVLQTSRGNSDPKRTSIYAWQPKVPPPQGTPPSPQEITGPNSRPY